MAKEKIIIFGNTNFSKMIAEYIIESEKYEITCFTVNKNYIEEKEILGIPVIEFEDIEKKYSPKDYKFIVTIGYTKMNTIREKAFKEIKEKGYYIENFIHPTACIKADKIGEGNIFLEGAFIGPHASIGDGNLFWNGVNVCHDFEIGNFNQISASTTIAGFVKVENNCFLGINCSIRDHVIVANKTLVGAGCFINENTEENSVYVPAKAIKLSKNSDEITI